MMEAVALVIIVLAYRQWWLLRENYKAWRAMRRTYTRTTTRMTHARMRRWK